MSTLRDSQSTMSFTQLDQGKEVAAGDEKIADSQNQPIDIPAKEANEYSGDFESQLDRIISNGEDLVPADSRHSKTAGDPFLVTLDETGLEDPYNWSLFAKLFAVAQLSILALTGSAGSAITAPAQKAIAQEFGTSQEVTVLTVSLYVLAFALGPLIWAPVSELYGRRMSLIPAMLGMGLFSIGAAVSKNLATLLIMRFFTGIFGSAPVSNVSAALGDMFAPKTRGNALAMYSIVVVGGPTLFPVVGAALTVNHDLGWRWTQWVQVIMALGPMVVSYFFLPEMYRPYLLKQKAARMRKETGDNRYHTPHQNVKLDAKAILTKHLARPIYMLLTEPIVTAVAFYASFIFGLLYMTLEVFPIVFEQKREWSLVPSTLPFLSLFAGVITGVWTNIANQPLYRRAVEKAGGKPVPEARCPPMAIGAIMFVIGLWWFGWTATPASIPWPVPVVGAAFIGAGFNVLFLQSIAVLIDSYTIYAASATSANTVLRSLLAAAMPLVAKPMFNNLGVGPAMSILAGIATLGLPIPFVMMKYGKYLRMRSKWAQK